MACTGPRFQVYLRLFGAISVECSDGNSCYERRDSRIGGESGETSQTALRKLFVMQLLCWRGNAIYVVYLHV